MAPQIKQHSIQTAHRKICDTCRQQYNAKQRVLNKRWRERHRETYNRKEATRHARMRAKLTPEARRALWLRSHLKRSYGLTLEEFDVMLTTQGGRCALCDGLFTELAPRRNRQTIHVDHDHATGKVRGLLCVNCNLGIGYFGESVAKLQRAIRYLNQGREGRDDADHLNAVNYWIERIRRSDPTWRLRD